MKRPDPPMPQSKERSLWGDASSLAFVFPISITLGFFIGKWIGGQLGNAAKGQWIGLLWGIATAFWELYKTAKRLSQKPVNKPK